MRRAELDARAVLLQPALQLGRDAERRLLDRARARFEHRFDRAKAQPGHVADLSHQLDLPRSGIDDHHVELARPDVGFGGEPVLDVVPVLTSSFEETLVRASSDSLHHRGIHRADASTAPNRAAPGAGSLGPILRRGSIWFINVSVYQKEFFAPTREEAVAMAVAYFKVDAGKLQIAEIPGSVGVVGMGERKCFVVSVAGTEDQLPPERQDRDRPRRDERRERGSRDSRESRGGRGRGDGERRGGDRGGDRGGGRGRGGDRSRGGGGDRRRPPRGDKPEGVDHEKLEAIAREAAERVKKSGTPETLSWMNSKERWVVHNYLRNVDGVTSVSEGEGAEKRLKIIPE